jgi:hypothetical protein
VYQCCIRSLLELCVRKCVNIWIKFYTHIYVTLPAGDVCKKVCQYLDKILHIYLCECRYRLEYYEQACAADTLTGRCAGQHQDCRKATLGLLGTDLHTNCVCRGDSFLSLGPCLAWKRLLWANPCVGESYSGPTHAWVSLTLGQPMRG